MRSYNLGFDKDKIAIVELNGDLYKQHKDTYVGRLKEYPGIEGVGFSFQKLGARDGYSRFRFKYKEGEFLSEVLSVSPELLSVMGVAVTEGRNFTEADEKGGRLSYIFNRVGKWLENFAYKTPVYWWIFALALLIVAAVTFAVVTFQNWRAANANPVESIKSE